MTTLQPFAADCSEEKSRTSPTTSSHPRWAMRATRDLRRTRQRTSRPRARSMRTTTEPIKPLPPVISIFMKRHKPGRPTVIRVSALGAPTPTTELDARAAGSRGDYGKVLASRLRNYGAFMSVPRILEFNFERLFYVAIDFAGDTQQCV